MIAKREITIRPFETGDISQFKEALSASALIHGLEPSFVSDFYATCEVSPSEMGRNQRDAFRIVKYLKEQLVLSEQDRPSLLVTNKDIFAGNDPFVFGFSNQEWRLGIVSTFRLTHWEEGSTPSLLQERILKAAGHEIGNIAGLSECSNKNCIMAQSRTLEELDARLPALCDICTKKVWRVRL